MSRKLEQNILTQIGRQVHAVIDRRHFVLTLQFEVAEGAVQFQPAFKRFQAADAAAVAAANACTW